MAARVARNPDGITRDKYCDMRMQMLRDLLESKIADIDEKTKLAKESMEYRLEGMNEFRASLKDQEAHLVQRLEMESELDPMKKDIQELRDFRISMQTLASQKSVNITQAVAVIGIILSIISLILKFI